MLEWLLSAILMCSCEPPEFKAVADIWRSMSWFYLTVLQSFLVLWFLHNTTDVTASYLGEQELSTKGVFLHPKEQSQWLLLRTRHVQNKRGSRKLVALFGNTKFYVTQKRRKKWDYGARGEIYSASHSRRWMNMNRFVFTLKMQLQTKGEKNSFLGKYVFYFYSKSIIKQNRGQHLKNKTFPITDILSHV